MRKRTKTENEFDTIEKNLLKHYQFLLSNQTSHTILEDLISSLPDKTQIDPNHDNILILTSVKLKRDEILNLQRHIYDDNNKLKANLTSSEQRNKSVTNEINRVMEEKIEMINEKDKLDQEFEKCRVNKNILILYIRFFLIIALRKVKFN
jgi:hypothetical protein